MKSLVMQVVNDAENRRAKNNTVYQVLKIVSSWIIFITLFINIGIFMPGLMPMLQKPTAMVSNAGEKYQHSNFNTFSLL